MTLACENDEIPAVPVAGPVSLRARLASGAMWALLAAVAGQAAGAAVGIVIARVIGRERFGELGMLRSTLAMFEAFSSLGAGAVAVKYVAELRETNPERAGRLIGLASIIALVCGCVMTLLVLVGAQSLARHALDGPNAADAPRLVALIRWMAPVLPFSALSAVYVGALNGVGAFKALSMGTLAIALLNSGVAVALVLVAGVPGVILAQLGCTVVGLVIFRALLARKCRATGITIRYRDSWAERRVVWHFAVPTVLGSILVAPVMWICNAILVNSPRGYAQMGLFNAANQWRVMLLFLPSVIAGPLLPIMSNLYGTGQFARLRRALIKSLSANILMVGLAASVVACFSRWLMGLYGRGFEDAVPTLLTVLGVAVLLAAGTVVAQLITSTGAMWMGLSFNAMWAAVMIVSAMILVPRLGALGLGLSYVIAYFVHTLVQLIYLWRRLRALEVS